MIAPGKTVVLKRLGLPAKVIKIEKNEHGLFYHLVFQSGFKRVVRFWEIQ